MNHRERVKAVMHYESYDRLPCVAFGYWTETLDKWAAEGHVRRETAELYRTTGDNGPADREVMDQLGFDFSWQSCVSGRNALFPAFERKVLRVEADGSQIVQDGNGHLVRIKPGLESIPGELGTLLTGREAWEKDYLPRLQYSDDRIPRAEFKKLAEESATREYPLWLHCGSLYGTIRDMLGVVELSYLQIDDEYLYKEVIDTMAGLALKVAEETLKCGIGFDGAHFWEDICFKNGPLVNPEVFAEFVGPHYREFADLLAKYGIDQISPPGAKSTAGRSRAWAAWTSACSPRTRPPWRLRSSGSSRWWIWAATSPAPITAFPRTRNTSWWPTTASCSERRSDSSKTEAPPPRT